MLALRKSAERGGAHHGWLETKFSFSFADYEDPRYMGFRALRVINEDIVAPSSGFPMHGHRDMEIITYVLEGALTHRDSTGRGATISAGEFQRMSAGRGIRHSEWNDSVQAPVHLLQIWIQPGQLGLDPGHEQAAFAAAEKQNRLRLVASPDAREGSLRVQQDLELYNARLEPGVRLEHALGAGRGAWLQVVRGALVSNGQALQAGDGLGISGLPAVLLEGGAAPSEVLLFDLA